MLFHALIDLEVSVRPTRDSAAVCCPLACCVLHIAALTLVKKLWININSEKK